LPSYVLRIAFRLAEGVAGYVEASREARCWQKGQNTRRAFFQKKRTVERSNDRFGFNLFWLINKRMLAFHPDFIRKYPLGVKIGRLKFFSYDVRGALHISENEFLLFA